MAEDNSPLGKTPVDELSLEEDMSSGDADLSMKDEAREQINSSSMDFEDAKEASEKLSLDMESPEEPKMPGSPENKKDNSLGAYVASFGEEGKKDSSSWGFSQATAGSTLGAGLHMPASGSGTFHCPLWHELKKPWRKRHPILFWGGIILIAILILRLAFGALGEAGDLGRKKVAQVNVEGVILDSKDLVSWIDKVRKDKSIHGVLLRVNSPGGGVTPSQEIYFALKRLAEAKPMVVSMGTLAASGGYYISLPGHSIIAAPSTVTGSIGVKMQLANAQKLFDFLGVSATSLTSGELKDAGSPFKPLSEEEKAYFMGVVMDMFDDFIGVVSDHRKLTPEQVKKIADGRVLTGRQALDAGLVDKLGDMHDAKELLYKLCGLEGEKVLVVEGPPKKISIVRELTESIFDVVEEKSMRASDGPLFMY